MQQKRIGPTPFGNRKKRRRGRRRTARKRRKGELVQLSEEGECKRKTYRRVEGKNYHCDKGKRKRVGASSGNKKTAFTRRGEREK